MQIIRYIKPPVVLNLVSPFPKLECVADYVPHIHRRNSTHHLTNMLIQVLEFASCPSRHHIRQQFSPILLMIFVRMLDSSRALSQIEMSWFRLCKEPRAIGALPDGHFLAMDLEVRLV